MKLYLGAYLVNYYNTSTPLEDWFDDAGWSSRVLPRIRDLAGAAKLHGFAGLAFDQELYPQEGGRTSATWDWNYPGSTHTEAEVRAQAEQRGEELMGAILDAFPGAEIAVYHAFFPGGWNEVVQAEVNNTEDAAADLLHIDFWDGMTRVEGYGPIRFYDSTFYKTPHTGTWETALAYNQNRVFATFSRGFDNWDHAAQRVYVSPFGWINQGPNEESAYDDARPPNYVAEQFGAFRKWGTGNEQANFAYGPLEEFDYSPYERAMRAASEPGVVDDADPTLEVAAGADRSRRWIEGTAHDNLAIRSVRWSDELGGSGVAWHRWRALEGGPDSSYVWETRWRIAAERISPGALEVVITAEDIKGNTATVVHPAP
jgi:hypothetical protein